VGQTKLRLADLCWTRMMTTKCVPTIALTGRVTTGCAWTRTRADSSGVGFGKVGRYCCRSSGGGGRRSFSWRALALVLGVGEGVRADCLQIDDHVQQYACSITGRCNRRRGQGWPPFWQHSSSSDSLADHSIIPS
jgi:hypothetical protein